MSALPNRNLLQRILGDYVRIKNRHSGEERLVFASTLCEKESQLYLGVRFDLNPQLYWFNLSSKWEIIAYAQRNAA